MSESLEDIFGKKTPATPQSTGAPAPKFDLMTALVLGLVIWLAYLAYQRMDRGHGKDEKDKDDHGQVDPAPKLEGARIVFVYEMKAASANQVEVVGNLSELQMRRQLKERLLLDQEMEDPAVKTLIADVDSKFKVKPPFMALVKGGKPFKAASFPTTIKASEVEDFVK